MAGRLTLVLAGLALGLVTACGAEAEAGEGLRSLLPKAALYEELFGSSVDSQVGSSRPPSAMGLSGVLILEENEPLEAVRIVRLNLATGRMAMEIDGYDPDRANARIVFLQSCGEFLTGSQLAISDEDGFVTPASPCDRNQIRSNLEDAALSADAQRIAVYDAQIDRDGFYELAGHGVLVYDASGQALGVLEGFTSPAWTPNGLLLLAGSGRDGGAPHGIYLASPDFRSVQRIDDGRLNNAVTGLVANPQVAKAAFVYNEQLWELDVPSGAPRRLLAYDFPVRFPTYSPDGSQIAFIVENPLDERMRRGEHTYFIHVFDRRDVIDVPIDFVPGGPISWAEE